MIICFRKIGILTVILPALFLFIGCTSLQQLDHWARSTRERSVPGWIAHSDIYAKRSSSETVYSAKDYWKGFQQGVLEAEQEISKRSPTIYGVGDVVDGFNPALDIQTGLPLLYRYKFDDPRAEEVGILIGHNARIMQEISRKGYPSNSKKRMTKEATVALFNEGTPSTLRVLGNPVKFEDPFCHHMFSATSVHNRPGWDFVYTKHYTSAVHELIKIHVPNQCREGKVVWLGNVSLAILRFNFPIAADPDGRIEFHTVVIDPYWPGTDGNNARILYHWIDK